jgi:hypothetical protein
MRETVSFSMLFPGTERLSPGPSGRGSRSRVIVSEFGDKGGMLMPDSCRGVRHFLSAVRFFAMNSLTQL